jgi:hypothetical protein
MNRAMLEQEVTKAANLVDALRHDAERGRMELQPDRLRLRQSALLKRVNEIVSVAEIDANRALLIVGQLREAMRAFNEPADAVARYEAARKSVDDMRKGLEVDA